MMPAASVGNPLGMSNGVGASAGYNITAPTGNNVGPGLGRPNAKKGGGGKPSIAKDAKPGGAQKLGVSISKDVKPGKKASHGGKATAKSKGMGKSAKGSTNKHGGKIDGAPKSGGKKMGSSSKAFKSSYPKK